MLQISTSSNVVRAMAIVLLLLGISVVGLSLAALAFAPVRAIAPGALGILFTASGFMMLETAGIEIDKQASRLTLWSHSLGRTRRKTYPLDAFHHLKIVRHWNESRRGPRKLYRISLTCNAGSDTDVELVDGLRTAFKARAVASKVAGFVGLPLDIVDATGASKIA